MHNPEYVLKNETHKNLWDFEIQTDPQISAGGPDPVIINKKRPPKRTEKTNKLWNREVTVIPVVIGCTWNNPQRIGKGVWKNLKLKDESGPYKLRRF